MTVQYIKVKNMV